ncbi:N-6 DNA methylase [Streptomyces sp. NPDC059718]
MNQLGLFGDDDIPETFTARPATARRTAARPAAAPRPALAAEGEPDGLFADPRPDLPAVKTRIPARRTVTPVLLGNPRSAGMRLGEAVAEAWHASNQGGYRMDIPVSIVAALAMFPIKGHTEDVTRIISGCTDFELLQGYREVYTSVWSSRPDLGAAMAPLMGWLVEDGVEEKVHAVRRVTDTALRYGVLQMTGDPDPANRCDVDLMSWTVTSLRSHGARQGLGEYHTPPEVCDVMARMTCGNEMPEKGYWFSDPAGGTGGMFRSLAQHLRELGLDPAQYGWALTDIDPLAAAGAAVNAHVWGLGPNVLISCGDSLADPELPQKAAHARQKLIEERDQVVGYLATVEAVGQAMAMVDKLMANQAQAD